VKLDHRLEVESRICTGWNMRYVQLHVLRDLIHAAKEEIAAGRKSAWAPAIERMDFLLSSENWASFVQDLKKEV
jgi:hypothetical protein